MKKFLIILIFFCGVLQAQENPDLKALLKSAVTINSKLSASEYEKLIALARVNRFNEQPSPSVEIMQDRIPFNLMDAGEFSITYMQPLKLFGKLDASEKYYSYQAIKPEIAREELQKDLTKEVKENYFLLSQNERKVRTNHTQQEIIKSITRSIEIKYSTSKASQTDILKSNTELQKLLYDEIQLNADRKMIVNNLRTLTGIDLPADYSTSDELITSYLELNLNDTLKLQNMIVANNPKFRLLNYEKTLNSLERNMTVLERKPDLTLKSGYMYMSDVHLNAFRLGAEIDLPFMPWNVRRIDASLQENNYISQEIDSRFNSALIYMRAELRNKITLINSQQEKIKFIKEITVPQLVQTLNSELIAYQTGTLEYMNVIDTYRMLRDTDFMLIEEETKNLLYINELERLVSSEILKIN